MAAVTADTRSMQSKFNGEYLNNLSHDIASFYSEPDKYLEPTDSMREEGLSLSKKMYDFMKEFECFSSQNSLKELLVSEFDNEQIWQEIQLQNNPTLVKFRNNLKGLKVENVFLNLHQEEVVKKPKQGRKKKINKNMSDGIEESIGNGDIDQCEERIEEIETKEILEPRKVYKKTVVDDDFFRLREMEEYMDKLDQLELAEMKNNDSDEDYENASEIDFFKEKLASSDDENDDGSIVLKYNDFFDPPANSHTDSIRDSTREESNNEEDTSIGKQAKEERYDQEYESDDDSDENMPGSDDDMAFSGEEDEELEVENKEGSGSGSKDYSSDENEDGGKTLESTFERRQRQMQEKIKKLEEENLREKPWQLMGETIAKKRPLNSLLEEFVTFDVTSVGAPVVTEETTLSLEELIKQRIKDQAWDDVIRKEKPVTQPYEYKKAPELNQEKSKLSLAEVYEKEYLKQAEDEKEEKENEQHTNIQNLMDNLFVQLDALSNFHYTPKPPKPEIKVITNVASLQMEEVLPITMTDASQLAPEEVFEKKKGELVCADEKTDEDRKRERRRKKIKKKFAVKEKEKKEKLKVQKPGNVSKLERTQAIDSLKKGVRNTIISSSRTIKNVKSSNEFFSKLQDEVKNNISKGTSKQKKVAKKNMSAEFLKL